MDKSVRRFSTIMLILVTVTLIFNDRHQVIPYFQQAGMAVICLNVISLLMGFMSARLLRLYSAQSICIAIESGIQNSGLAITIAIVSLQNIAFTVAPGVYTLIMYFTGLQSYTKVRSHMGVQIDFWS